MDDHSRGYRTTPRLLAEQLAESHHLHVPENTHTVDDLHLVGHRDAQRDVEILNDRESTGCSGYDQRVAGDPLIQLYAVADGHKNGADPREPSDSDPGEHDNGLARHVY